MLQCGSFYNHFFLQSSNLKKTKEKQYVANIYVKPKPKHNTSFYQEIKTIDNLKSFFDYLSNEIKFTETKALIAFDIDNVILHKRKLNYLPSNNGCLHNDVHQDYIISGTNDAINELSRYADVICITARSKYQNPRLQKYNINLLSPYNKITLNYDQKLELNKFGYFYEDNVIYTELLEKGTALKNFYLLSSTHYDKTIFIDDYRNNCLSVTYTLGDCNIDITSFHLKTPGYNKKCSFNIGRSFIKQQAYFHLNEENTQQMDLNTSSDFLC